MIYRSLSPVAVLENEALSFIFYFDICKVFKALYTLRVSKEDYNAQKQHGNQINYLTETVTMVERTQQGKHFLIKVMHPIKTRYGS